MTTPQEVIKVRRELKRQINWAHRLHRRCIGLVADGDLRMVDRETAEHRAKLALCTALGLERSLERVQEALNG